MTAHAAAEAAIGVGAFPEFQRHPLVLQYLRYFSGPARHRFAKWLKRAAQARQTIEPILARHGLSSDLLYLAMVESGFSTHATSTAAAKGVWQFISKTGRAMGLRQSKWIDERADLERATHAAARYLKRLYGTFGDWHLAWAAYNAGPRRVRKAISETGTRNFWKLVARQALPRETMHYVPSILAAARIGANPTAFGFEQPIARPLPRYAELATHRDIHLGELAAALRIDPTVLADLNPAVRCGLIPARYAAVRVPAEKQEEATQWLLSPPKPAEPRRVYAVQAGDSLRQIARNTGTRVRKLMVANLLQRNSCLQPGRRVVIPLSDDTPSS